MRGRYVGLSMLYCLGYPFSYMTEQLRNVEVAYVEVLDESYHALNSRRIRILKEASRSQGLSLTVHAPFVDINIASPNRSFRRVILKRLKKSIELTGQLGANLWVFHSGLRTGVSHFQPEEDWKLNVQSILDLLDVANKNGVKVTLENTPEPFPFILKNADDFARFYEDLGDSNLSLTLDIGHANVNGQIYDFIERFHERIAHVHASDNDGTFDSHLGIGEGNINWARVAESLRNVDYSGVIIIESERKVRESIQTLKEIFSNNS